jgi:hypothetical protein
MYLILISNKINNFNAASNNGNTGPPTTGYHATQQYWSGDRIHGIIAARSTRSIKIMFLGSKAAAGA